jgi:class 3 adenylate cyclase
MGKTRRLAAIMAIDVVGYSRLVGEDEAGTERAVREHREAAQRDSLANGGFRSLEQAAISPRNDCYRPY